MNIWVSDKKKQSENVEGQEAGDRGAEEVRVSVEGASSPRRLLRPESWLQWARAHLPSRAFEFRLCTQVSSFGKSPLTFFSPVFKFMLKMKVLLRGFHKYP